MGSREAQTRAYTTMRRLGGLSQESITQVFPGASWIPDSKRGSPARSFHPQTRHEPAHFASATQRNPTPPERSYPGAISRYLLCSSLR
jgi:hypothetical protein